MEQNYEFRKRMMEFHKPNRRDYDVVAKDTETIIDETWKIIIPAESGETLRTAAEDLQDYLKKSMNVLIEICSDEKEKNTIFITTETLSPQFSSDLDTPRSYRLVCKEHNVIICSCDEAGAMQGCFFIEDLMNMKKAPFIEQCDIVKKPLYSPRMIHGGYGKGEYPDEILCNIAHHGFDTVVMTVGKNTVLDKVRDVTERAQKYGIGVYAFSDYESTKHPDEADAKEYYESAYGNLLKNCPKIKGVILVGESIGFPSKDPNTSGKDFLENFDDGLPSGKPTPSHWPCTDYPDLINVIKDVVRSYSKDVDIVFWTYNWGYVEKSHRIKLIEILPKDISLLVTYEMYEMRKTDGINTTCPDYTLSFAGPASPFVDEAKAAKENGVRLYAMTNTGGNTWDFGAIPYQPAPYQWIDRYDSMEKCRQDYGLCGLLESHTYGFWPSFICELAKWTFWSGNPDSRTVLKNIAVRDFGEKNALIVLKVWEKWSEGIRSYVSTNEDQYGPCRVGPAYPLVLCNDVQMPFKANCEKKRSWYMFFLDYASNRLRYITTLSDGNSSTLSQRLPITMKRMEECARLHEEGAQMLEEIFDTLTQYQKDEARFLINIAKFIAISCRTTANVKKWFMLRNLLMVETDGEKIAQYCREMIETGKREIENAKAAIPLVNHDSRLGWEASMDYVADEYLIQWKIRQVQWVIDKELPRYIELAN